jgi:hypothetical protein
MTGSVKHGDDDTSDHRVMTSSLTVILGQWYDAHPAVRRLWALEHSGAIHVVITLEPTSDGDDAMPAWLAHSRRWASDLQSLTHREVQLRPIYSAAPEDVPAADDGTIVAEFSWRDAWS